MPFYVTLEALDITGESEYSSQKGTVAALEETLDCINIRSVHSEAKTSLSNSNSSRHGGRSLNDMIYHLTRLIYNYNACSLGIVAQIRISIT
ncbi:hypothetical protein E3Q18_02153 [Wallemia mellicola]|uniref:Uncharacterized protein n=1 Tax=Wallemia mellicola TaxID=1708541 RepID=A0A4T0QZB2_9BASI|nr:hypothetical protein E3Q24_02313 [Wallemia mellicola]TIB76086.1 hypothetical protein E3Q23_01992 [Wallemia mellicola]TIB83785.1 hypothetical protein E3Q21_02714 [Wallemia mellicola]TIB86798.1 hypothetical protein E3Q20_02706 [Wallemia mellicola]TIB98253.1 hypothetical protein E3Q18_02153 [Wallemia mellicola]